MVAVLYYTVGSNPRQGVGGKGEFHYQTGSTILLPPDKNVHIEKTCNAYMLLFKLTHYKRICIGRNNKVVFCFFF